MKNLLCLIAILFALRSHAQLSEDVKIVIVSCKSGDLYIDGTKIITLEADDAHQEKISVGEHYLQLKTSIEKYSLTLKVDQTTKGIIKIGCGPTPVESPKAVKVIEKELYLSSSFVTPIADQNLIGLDNGDEILLNCDVVNKKGTASISIKKIETGQEIYKRENFESIIGERIPVPTKGIYLIDFSTNALLGKNLKFSIARIPSSSSSPYFKTTVKKSFDTTFLEILNTTTLVHSTSNSSPNKSKIKINLPSNTTYWAYWIGVDQGAKENMKTFANQLPKAATLLSANPLVLFGMRLIPSLPIVNATSTVSYRFMDSQNAQAFVNGQQYSYFKFKHASNISSDYSLIDQVLPDIVLCFDNSSLMTGKDVDIRVVAFTVKPKFVLEE